MRSMRSYFSPSLAALAVFSFAFASSCTDPAPLQARIAELEAQTKKCEDRNASLTKKIQKKIQLESENKRLRIQLESLRQSQKAEANSGEAVANAAKALDVKPDDKLYATFETSVGTLVAELFWKRAPKTVENFVRLAEGTTEWTDPRDRSRKKAPLYNGTIFHRVIPNFMVQGGDPLGTGTGGPGYKFKDEFHSDLRHSSGGILSMANSGPNTNGSQFFITERATPHLDRRHTVFGKVIENVDLVTKMARVEKQQGNPSKPAVDIVLKRVRIGRGKPKR